MLITRLYQAKPDEILYHYCDAASLKVILETGTLRFSDINMLNDATEARWGYKVFEEAATELLYKLPQLPRFASMDKAFFDKVDAVLSPLQINAHPFVACLSRSADQLSQWRAYSNDGKGYAIGFRAEAIASMPISLLGVQYDHKKQVEEMTTALRAIYLENEEANPAFGEQFRTSCAVLGSWANAFKNPAFAEEQEVRCVHVVGTKFKTGSIKFGADQVKLKDGTEHSVGEVEFRVTGDKLVAHLDLSFRKFSDKNLIAEIIVGPKCPNGPGNVWYLLGRHDYRNVRMQLSAATYR